jgi:hypothetical protein
VIAGGIFPKDEVEQQLMYFKNKMFTITDSLSDTIVTTTFCHEFVRNISAKIGCNPLLLSNGPELALLH